MAFAGSESEFDTWRPEILVREDPFAFLNSLPVEFGGKPVLGCLVVPLARQQIQEELPKFFPSFARNLPIQHFPPERIEDVVNFPKRIREVAI